MVANELVFLVVTLICWTPVTGKSIQNSQNQGPLSSQPHVFFTINAISGVNKSSGVLTNRRMELHWQNFNVHVDDWIGIFDFDPSTPAGSTNTNVSAAQNLQTDVALEKYLVTNGTGYQLTNVRLPEINLRSDITNRKEDHCLRYWLGYFRQGTVLPVKSNCLRIYPTWMTDLRDIIGDVPLHSLMIPGTHDAGAWKIYNGTETDEDDSIQKYTYTQEESIFNQLAYGIRYLDIRVAHYPDTEQVFWVNHGPIQLYPLINLLEDIKNFTRQFNQIIFMDFHKFPVGFGSLQVHRNLYDLVSRVMGDFLAPSKNTLSMDRVTLNQLWDINKTVIWTYGDEFHREKDLLWPTLPHAWGNVNAVSELENYLEGAMTTYGCRRQFWSAMAEETPKGVDFFEKPLYGVRGFAQEINIPVTHWFEREAWYSKANIISTDYFLGNNIIEMSVTGNRDGVNKCLT